MFQYFNANKLILRKLIDYDKPHFKVLSRYENYKVTKEWTYVFWISPVTIGTQWKHGSCEDYVVRRTSETTIYFTCVQYCILWIFHHVKLFNNTLAFSQNNKKKGTKVLNVTLLLNFENVLMKRRWDDVLCVTLQWFCHR